MLQSNEDIGLHRCQQRSGPMLVFGQNLERSFDPGELAPDVSTVRHSRTGAIVQPCRPRQRVDSSTPIIGLARFPCDRECDGLLVYRSPLSPPEISRYDGFLPFATRACANNIV